MAICLVVASACGGGTGSDTSGSGEANPQAPVGTTLNSTATFNLSLTDAPVDGAEHVWIQFRGAEIKARSGTTFSFYFCRDAATGGAVVATSACAEPAPRRIDVLALNSGVTDDLLSGQSLPAGDYDWLRLLVDAEPGVHDSTIVIAGAEHELTMPGSAHAGLQLNHGFEVNAAGADFTVDFDLRRSIHVAANGTGYLLRPVLRMVDSQSVGTISGAVDAALLQPGCLPLVYVFAGAGSEAIDDLVGPVTTARVTLDSATGAYRYTAAFLEVETYTVAFACPPSSTVNDHDVRFSGGTATIEVIAGVNIEHNFVGPGPRMMPF